MAKHIHSECGSAPPLRALDPLPQTQNGPLWAGRPGVAEAGGTRQRVVLLVQVKSPSCVAPSGTVHHESDALTMWLCPRGTRLQAEQSQPTSEQSTYPGYGRTTWA
jgi:hypothetical protein